jgi:RNA polymerase sigma-70 factor (ECF subfamily)
MEEIDWIRNARDGDTAAFARLVDAYQNHVYNLTYRMLGERMAAEDAAQEAFLRAFKNLHRYDPDRSFRTWLLSIAAHHAIDRVRRRRPQIPLEKMAPQAVNDPGPERQVVQRERSEAIQQLLTLLSPTDRAAVTLLYWYDYSYEEIAETLDLTVSAVKSRLYRARRTMAQAMEEGFDVL